MQRFKRRKLLCTSSTALVFHVRLFCNQFTHNTSTLQVRRTSDPIFNEISSSHELQVGRGNLDWDECGISVFLLHPVGCSGWILLHILWWMKWWHCFLARNIFQFTTLIWGKWVPFITGNTPVELTTTICQWHWHPGRRPYMISYIPFWPSKRHAGRVFSIREACHPTGMVDAAA